MQMKKGLALLLVLCLALAALPVRAYAAEELHGEWENFQWTLDEETGTLTISGEGKTPDFGYNNSCPWQNYNEMISHVVLEEGIIGIGRTFEGLINLESVTIPNTVTSINSRAFNGCEKLELHIPKNVVTINEELIGGNGDPVELGNPSRHESFRGVKKLIVDTDNPMFSSDEYGVLYNKDKTVLMYAPTSLDGSYTIPNGVVTIGSEAFADCKKLTEVIIPDSVTKIEKLAFYNCLSLNNVTLSNNLAIIGEMAFRFCAQLNAITFPNTLTEIGRGAFHQTALVEVDIPEGAFVGSHAFSNCTALKTITWREEGSYDNLYWKFEPESGILIISGNGDMTSCAVYGYPWSVYSYANQVKQLVLEPGITSIGSYAFVAMGIEEVTIPENVTKIGGYAFYDTGLKEVTFPDSLQTIGHEAFAYCSDLVKADLPKNLFEIQEDAFLFCSLEKIELPSSLETIGRGAFNGNNITELQISNPNLTIGGQAFGYCEQLVTVELPDGMTEIPLGLFNFCSALENVQIPSTVTDISEYAFRGCSSLAEITIPDSVKSIWPNAFEGCEKLAELVLPASVEMVSHDNFVGGKPDKIVVLNPNCNIKDDLQGWASNTPLQVYGYVGSTAEEYANQHEQAVFIPLDSVSLVDDEPTAQKWNEEAGGEVSYHIDHSLETDVEVFLDGVRVDPANYVVTEGSTIVTFKENYLATLAAKEYEVNILFSDGGIETSLIVTRQTLPAPGNPGTPGTNLPPAVVPPHNEASGEADPGGSAHPTSPNDPPKTGDFAAPALWACLMAVSGLAIALSFAGKKKRE